MLLFYLLIILLLCGYVTSIPIDTRLEEYCKCLLAIFESNPQSTIVQGIIEPWLCHSLEAVEEGDFFLPKVLIWCPLTRFNLPLKCPTHGNSLRTGVWKVSTKMSSEPRLLFDLDGNTLLIARYYVCSSSGIYHRILSSDQLLLDQIQKDLEIPFILSHRSGYTLRFLTHVRVESGLGINFNDISNSLMKMNLKNFANRRNLMMLLFKHNDKPITPKYLGDKEFHENPLYSYPSDDHIREMFLMNFKQTRDIYEGDMKKLSASSISIFYSYKLCHRIGMQGKDDKWVPDNQYLLIVLNEFGEIIKWCFCESEDFGEVKEIMMELNDRFTVQGSKLTHVMTGHCCEWRANLASVFGSHIQVKRDLYTTTEWLIMKLNFDDIDQRSCLDDFDRVFRFPDDRGKERMKPTPPPLILKCQFHQFMMKWRSSLTPLAIKLLIDMEEHIDKGCLSEIPIGHEIRRSDDLSALLDKSLVHGASRIGPELAFALVTVLFYILNGKIRRKKWICEGNKSSSWKEIDGESFGFISKSNQPPPLKATFVNSDPNGTGSSSSVSCLLREDVLQFLVPEALELHDMLRSLSERCSADTLNVWDWPSIRPEKALSLLISKGREEQRNDDDHDARLQERLQKFNLRLVGVDKDGNCAFTSVASQLKDIIDKDTEVEFFQFLSSLGMKETQTIPDLSRFLRYLFVREITNNMCEYYPYVHGLTEDLFLEEARSFQLDGVFTSQIGDFIMKALSKVMCCAIVVISSIPSVEVIPFIPTLIKCKTPLFVAYNQGNSGHYDSTADASSPDVIAETKQLSKYVSTKGKCRCGRGKNSGAVGLLSCTNQANRGKYLTRCPCHRLQQGCTVMCRCVNCGNEFTTEETKAEMTADRPIKRRRTMSASKKRKKGEDFIRELREQVPISQMAWSPFESCVFEASLRFLAYSGVEQTAENILEMYNFIAKSTSVTSMGIALRCKTFNQVTCKLNLSQNSTSTCI